jgi:hypothetical protein
MSVYVTEILDQAREILIRDGWCQGVGRDAMGRCCLAEAIWGQEGAQGCLMLRNQEAYYRVCKVLRVRLLSVWNDKPGRTLDEVLDALAKAADIARADNA